MNDIESLHNLRRKNSLTFDERSHNSFNPMPVCLQYAARGLLKLLEIAIAVAIRPTGMVFDDRASGSFIVCVTCIMSTVGEAQVVRDCPGNTSQNAGLDVGALFRRVPKVVFELWWPIFGKLIFTVSAAVSDDGDENGRSTANRADNRVPGFMISGSVLVS